MSRSLYILYIGSLNKHSNSNKRFKTLGLMGFKTIGIDVDQYIYKGLFIKFHHHLNIGPGIKALNKEVLSKLKASLPDIIWIDNKSYLQEATLKEIKDIGPGIKIINLITDDITGKLKYQWRLSLKNARYIDYFFVQRKVNISELKQHGADNVELCYRSYDPEFHRPIDLDEKANRTHRTKVGFIGTYENNREEFISYLIQNGIEVSITGDGWPKGKHWKIIKPFYRGPSIYGLDYIKTINGMDIALHFLRHGNRDEQDSRTFEIPACGVFMLAEKSDVHLSLFKENEEAVYFETKEELLTKVKYYLNNNKKRLAVAKAGLARCIQSGYSHERRLSEVIDKIVLGT